MVKAFISQPMRGKKPEEIQETRQRAVEYLTAKGYEVVGSYFQEYPESELKNAAIYFLGKSLEKMAECDAVYFCKDWAAARGCRVEHRVANAYGLDLLYER